MSRRASSLLLGIGLLLLPGVAAPQEPSGPPRARQAEARQEAGRQRQTGQHRCVKQLCEEGACEEQDEDSCRLAGAEAAFRAGRLVEALEELSGLSGEGPASSRARFLEAYVRFKQGELDAAARLLDGLESDDGSSEAELLRGLLAYRRDDTVRARRHFAAVVARGEQPWAAAARSALTRLAVSGESTRTGSGQAAQPDRRAPASPELGTAPAAARPSVHCPEGRSGSLRLSIDLELGLGLDTMPSFLDETPSTLADAGMALHAAAAFSLRRAIGRRGRVGAGLRALERLFALSGEGADQTSFGLWLETARLARENDRVRLDLSLGYTFDLHGHQPLLSRPWLALSFALVLRPWLGLMASAALDGRLAHDEAYRHLEALGTEGSVGMRTETRWLRAEVAFSLLRDWAESASATLLLEGKPVHGHGGQSDGSVSYLVETDYSLWALGPAAGLRIELPWRLSLAANARLHWRFFERGDVWIRLADGRRTEIDSRRDMRLVVEAGLSRALPAGLLLALRFATLDNFSTMRLPELGLDRNYSRRMLVLALGWSWGS